MAFLNHGRQLRTSQWVTAVEDYNKEAHVHLKIHWAGATEVEHIRVSEGGVRLTSTSSYKHIVQKDDTYIKWSTKPLVGKHPLKSLESNLALPYKTPSDSFKRKPKRVYETMNEDEILKNMVGAQKCKRARKPMVSYDTETDDDNEVGEPVTREPPCLSKPPSSQPMVSYDTETDDDNEVGEPVTHEPPSNTGSSVSRLLPYAEALAALPYAEALAVPRVVRVRALQPGEVSDDSIPWAYAVHAVARRMESQVPQPEVAEPLPQVAEPLPQVAEPQPEVAEPQPEVAEPQPEVAVPQPEVPEPQPEQQQGTSVTGDLVSLAALTHLIQPLIERVNHVTDVAFSAQSQTIHFLSQHFGFPPLQPAPLQPAPLQ